MARSVQVFCDSHLNYIVALIASHEPVDFWPSWRIDTREGVYGPNLVGNWLRFMPSDWHDAAEPFPERVSHVADWAATSEELHQFLAKSRRGEWMLNPAAPQPPAAVKRRAKQPPG